MLICDIEFDQILNRVMARWLATENRGSLGPALTNELLKRLKVAADETAGRILTSAEFEYTLELADFEEDDPACGAYVRQYMQFEKGEQKKFVGRGMTFELMRQCVGRAGDAGWLGPITKTIDPDASQVWKTVAEMMLEIDCDEIAFRVVQGWKKRKITGIKSLTTDEIICDINKVYLDFEIEFSKREFEQARKLAGPKYQAVKWIQLLGKQLMEEVMEEVRDEVRADARKLRRFERHEQ